MKKRLTAVLTAIFIIISVFGSVRATDNAFVISIEPQNARIGNAYYQGEAPTFSIMLQNNLGYYVDAELQLVIRDDLGNVVNTVTRTVGIDSRQIKLIGYTPDLTNKFGVYTITANMNNDMHIATDEIRFSYTEGHNKNLDSLGFSCHFSKTTDNYAKTEKSGEILRESGAGWVRDEINWSAVETGGTPKYVVPERYDTLVNEAIANGKKVMLLVTGGNTLYETGTDKNGNTVTGKTCLPTTDTAVAAFADFAAFVAEHFKGRVDTFEIFNEPDEPGFHGHDDWLGANGNNWDNNSTKSAEAYAKLIKAVYPAVKSVYRGEEDKVTVVSGGCLPVRSDTGYLYKMLSADGVQNYIDAVAVHPYSIDATPGDMCSGSDYDFTKQLRRVKSFTSKPIYITEYGASSFGDAENNGVDSTSPYKGYGNLGEYGEFGQATALVRAYMVVARDPQIEKMFVYNFKEKGEIPGFENNLGVVDYNYTPKNAYAALSAMSTILKNAEPKEAVAANETNYAFGDTVKVYEFADTVTGDNIFVTAAGGAGYEWSAQVKVAENVDPASGTPSWSLDNDTKTATINSYIGGTVKAYDMFGNEKQLSDGSCRLWLQPVYIVCSKPQRGVALNGNTVEVKGSGAESNGMVTALVLKKNVIGQSVVYIDEVTADKYGRYEFSFEKTDGDIYSIRMYNGSGYTNNRYDLDNYDIDMKYYVNNAELEPMDISKIRPGTTVKIQADIVDKSQTDTALIAYGCVYGNNSVLLDADTAKTDWNAEHKTVLETEIKITEDTDIDSLSFMLWDSDMRPVLGKIQGN